MESQLQRPHGHTYDDPQHARPHSVVEDEGANHHEKKSVLKKVKAKAKKIKDTITKYGHSHDHEHENHYGDQDEDEEDDEDEEMVEDPEVHGAPVNESAAIRSSISAGQGVNLEKPTALGEDRYDARSAQVVTNPPGQGQEHYAGQPEVNLGRPTAAEAVHAPEDKNISFPPETYGTNVSYPSVSPKKDENTKQQGVKIDEPEGLDPHAPKNRPGAITSSNYQTKMVDPTGDGGEEAGMEFLTRSLDELGVYDESVPRTDEETERKVYTGSHDQFAPQPIPTAGEFAPKTSDTFPGQGITESTPKSYDPSKPEDLPRDTLSGKSSDQSGYIVKTSTATASIADKDISAKNVVASKLGYGDSEGAQTHETEESSGTAKLASPTEYAYKVAATVTEKLGPVYAQVVDVGSSVMSKVKGTETTHKGKRGSPKVSDQCAGDVPDKGVSVKEYLAEKFKPGEEDKALSEVISGALHKKKEELGKTGESKPMGKVSESEEVARYLGTGKENKREGDDARAAGAESTGTGVVDRLKGAVSSWVGKGYQHQSSQGSPAGSFVSNEGPVEGGRTVRATEERRLQESGH